MPIGRRQGDAADRHPGVRPRRRWAPDGKKLCLRLRPRRHGGHLPAGARRPEHPELVKAHKFKVKQLTGGAGARVGA